MFFLILYILVGLLFLEINLNKNEMTKGFSTKSRLSQMISQLIRSLLSFVESIIDIFSAVINIGQTLTYFILWPISYLYILHIVSKIKKKEFQ